MEQPLYFESQDTVSNYKFYHALDQERDTILAEFGVA